MKSFSPLILGATLLVVANSIFVSAEDEALSAGQRELKLFDFKESDPSYKLGECQGDCDTDANCQDGLVCNERGGGDSIVGCDGVDGARNDYCARPGGGGGGGGGTTTNTNPTTTTTRNGGGGGGGNNVQSGKVTVPNDAYPIRLYWENGYYWQETRKETFWCIGCRRNRCNEGTKMYIDDCRSSKSRRPARDFRMIPKNNREVQVQLDGTNLCWQRSSRDIYLERCNSSKDSQLWYANKGDFKVGNRFELSQTRGNCVTQRHHPKYDEEVEIEPCGTARRGDTSYWEFYLD